MNQITLKAPAKLNLSLDITGIRENDGYHLLSSIMQSIDLYDIIELEKSNEITLECGCKEIPVDSSNLTVRAAQAFFDYTELGCGVNIKLYKKIPSGAGMGGGSADAAAVLNGLNTLYETGLHQYELYEIGIGLGADVPFCIHGGTALVTGVGENIVGLKDLFSCHFVVVKPDFSISTPEAYGVYDSIEHISRPNTNKLIQAIYEQNIEMFCRNMGNVLEAAADRKEIQEIIEELKEHGAFGSRMTGSGSAVFGIFREEQQARNCVEKIEGKYPHVYFCNPCKK